MLFNSLTYILFAAIVTPLVVFGPRQVRNTVLLLGSLTFYAFWRVDFVALIVVSAFIDFYAGGRIAEAMSPSVRRGWLSVSVVMNLLVLGFFKYTYFIVGTTQSIFQVLNVPFEVTLPHILLPLGISFYTFQSMSYTIDVYRRVQEPVRHFPLFLTYVSFWPQLVAGPILRTSEVVPQIQRYRRPDRGEVAYGLEEILQGLFKKLVLADTLAPMVDAGYAVPVSQLGMLDVWTLAFLFGFQIYFDFSGYSSIALGSARLLGFSFPRNFNWPYLATSPRDFWRRWHISLSTWIRDYLYLPLQGVRFRGTGKGFAAPKGEDAAGPPVGQASEARRTAALFATWFIMGLWHGANWTFALWGVYHALLVVGHRGMEPVRAMLPAWAQRLGGWAVTLPLAMLGWVFFRAQSVGDSTEMFVRAFDVTRLRVMSLRETTYLTAFLFMMGFLAVAAAWKLNSMGKVHPVVRYPVLILAQGVMIFLVFLTLRQVKSFIYFQF